MSDRALHVSRPGCVWGHLDRHRDTLSVAWTIPVAARRGVGVVDIFSKRVGRVRQFFGLPGLRLFGFLARDRDVGPITNLCWRNVCDLASFAGKRGPWP